MNAPAIELPPESFELAPPPRWTLPAPPACAWCGAPPNPAPTREHPQSFSCLLVSGAYFATCGKIYYACRTCTDQVAVMAQAHHQIHNP